MQSNDEFANVPEENEIPETPAMKRFDSEMRELIDKLKFPDELPDHADYKKPYLILFNGITDALDSLDRMNFGKVRNILMDAQQEAEEAYLNSEDE